VSDVNGVEGMNLENRRVLGYFLSALSTAISLDYTSNALQQNVDSPCKVDLVDGIY
jgi:hypothetical protein